MKFYVEVKEIHSFTVEVEADTPEHAAYLANQKIEAGEGPDQMNYVDTLDPDEWNISDEHGNYHEIRGLIGLPDLDQA